MKSITKIILEKEIIKQFFRLKPGVVLDVGSKFAPYKKQIPHTKYMTLDINPQIAPDIVSDIHEVSWEFNYFDTIIATEVLEHCYSPEKAVNEIYRLLKNGGVCILSTRFFYRYHPDPKDYYRFTKDSLEYLFRKFSWIEIYPHGNRLGILWELLPGKLLLNNISIFNSLISKINFRDNSFPLGFVVYATK